MILPQLTPVKHVSKQRPPVPEIICDAPHIGIFFIVPRLVDQCRPRRERQHNAAPALFYRAVQHFNLMLCRVRIVRIEICITDIITLDIINAPLRIQTDDRIIIFLRASRIFAHAVHVGIPAADRRRICDLIGSDLGSQHWQVPVRCDPWNPPHDVNPKL